MYAYDRLLDVGTVPHAANIPISATSTEAVEWMHHFIPRDSYSQFSAPAS